MKTHTGQNKTQSKLHGYTVTNPADNKVFEDTEVRSVKLKVTYQ